MQPNQNIQGFRKGPCGFEFKNDKLYHFSDRHVVVMRPWPQPMAWCKRRSHNWRPIRKAADEVLSCPGFFGNVPALPEFPKQPFALPDGQLTLPGIAYEEWAAKRQYRDDVAIRQFADLIPDEVCNELMKFRERRWHLLSVFARCPGALDLSRSNPALLYALASNWIFHKPAVSQPIRAVRGLINRKQRVIQQWLGFPDTETVRRVLSKIETNALSVRTLFFLRSALADPACVKLLRHLPRITSTSLALVSHHNLRPHITPCLLHDAISRKVDILRGDRWNREMDPLWVVLDTVRMCNAVNWERCPQRFHSLAAVQRLHDELVPRIGEAYGLGENNLPARLPAPPFVGTADIVPLTTVQSLIQEGREQHNCAAIRAPSVAQGKEYLYSVLRPVRGTLSIYFNGYDWTPIEFRLACNKGVPPEIRKDTFATLLNSGRYASQPPSYL